MNAMKRQLCGAAVIAALATIGPSGLLPLHAQGTSTILLQEGFEDVNFVSRGWYDGTGGTLSTSEKHAGNGSLECRFLLGATACTGGAVGRHLLQDTDSVYLSYYIKYSTNWVGSGKPYHPHMFQFITNVDSAYVGPAYTHLTAYVEEVGGNPLLAIQDGRNIDETRIGVDLTGLTEQRAVAGCNGDSDGTGNGECYPAGTVHWNGKKWFAGSVFFDSSPSSPRYKANWHLVEAYFKLNTIVNGKAVADGVAQYWYDGNLVLDRTGVVFRTGARSTMKFNQFLIAPYIGDGSPTDQRFWVDNLLIATNRPQSPPPPPGSPGPPTNLRIIRP